MIKILKLKILFSKWIGKIPYLPVYLVFLIDLLIILFSLVSSFVFLKSVDQNYLTIWDSFIWSSMIMLSLGAAMLWKKTFRGFVRFTDIYEIINFILVFTSSFLLFGIIYFLNFYYGLKLNIPIYFIFLGHVGAFMIIILYRLMIKEIFFKFQTVKKKTNNVLIFGAGHSGMMVYQMLKREVNSKFNVCCFFDDDKSKYGKLLYGVKIFMGDGVLEQLIIEKEIVELIVAVKRISNKRKKELFDLCYQYDIKVRFLPSLETMDSSQFEFGDLRSIKLEELLGRDPIELDQKHLIDSFQGKIVLVTGAGGSIGSELCRQIARYPIQKLILLDSAESALYDIHQELVRKNYSFFVEPVLADIRNVKSVKQIFSKYKPNLVFHAAAYKHVPLMETFPKLAIDTNIIGTKNLADASVSQGVEKFILISTDKAVNPTNVMGASKRMAELYIQSRFYESSLPSKTQFITTRFGNVLGSNGSVIPLFMKQIEAGGPVTVTHKEIERFFMTIPEACRLVMEAGSMGNGGEIYVFDMGEPVRIYDLAEKMISLSGKVPNKDISIEITGLRSGEKLYEELIGMAEKFKNTHHPKIHIVQSFVSDYQVINTVIENLAKGICEDVGEDVLIASIKQVVPEFVSSYSRFTILDN